MTRTHDPRFMSRVDRIEALVIVARTHNPRFSMTINCTGDAGKKVLYETTDLAQEFGSFF